MLLTNRTNFEGAFDKQSDFHLKLLEILFALLVIFNFKLQFVIRNIKVLTFIQCHETNSCLSFHSEALLDNQGPAIYYFGCHV